MRLAGMIKQVTVPPRSGRLSQHLLASFDVDCGELIPGQRVIARGLTDEGTWPDALGSKPPAEVGGTWQMISLEYELVPGFTDEDIAAAPWGSVPIVDAVYSTDVPLAWSTGDERGGLASFDVPPGEVKAVGQCGPYPLPAEAKQVFFRLFAVLDARGNRIWRSPQPVGDVVVGLADGSAQWRPKTTPAE